MILLKDQAYKWAQRFQRRHGKGYVSLYEMDEAALRNDCLVLEFTDYSDDWIDFIFACRNGNDKSNFEVVIGGVANDKVFNAMELYFEGLIEKAEALRRLKYETPNLQYCFRSQDVINKYLYYAACEVLQ